MNGLECRGPCFGCDVYGADNNLVTSIRAEGETCVVTLPKGTQATLCSFGIGQGFYIQLPTGVLSVERNYPYASSGNSFLKLALGGRARPV